jgi:carbon storage regulator
MLVMRRRPGEGIQLGEDIEIEILEITHGRVKIGIKAPASYTITRREVALTKLQNVIASRSVTPQEISVLTQRLSGL